MHLEVVGDLACRVPVQAHQDPLDPQEHSRLFVTLGLLAESQQLGNGGLPAVRKRWAHIAIIAHFTNDVELFMRTYIVWAFIRQTTSFFSSGERAGLE